MRNSSTLGSHSPLNYIARVPTWPSQVEDDSERGSMLANRSFWGWGAVSLGLWIAGALAVYALV